MAGQIDVPSGLEAAISELEALMAGTAFERLLKTLVHVLSVRKNPFIEGTPTWRLVMEVSGGTGTTNGLACFIFRFLRRPL